MPASGGMNDPSVSCLTGSSLSDSAAMDWAPTVKSLKTNPEPQARSDIESVVPVLTHITTIAVVARETGALQESGQREVNTKPPLDMQMALEQNGRQ